MYRRIPFIILLLVAGAARAVDFNGDGTGEIALFRPATGLWAVRDVSRFYFGDAGDYPVPLNFNSSSAAVTAIFRPRNGLWAVRDVSRDYFGNEGDSPVAADFDGDGTDDRGIYRSSAGLWAIKDVTRAYFGSSMDIPVPADFDGDGQAEIAVFRGESGLWAARGLTRFYFGGAADLPIPADFAGAGTAAAVYRGENGLWAIRGGTRAYFGRRGDIPQPFDAVGDGTNRLAIFRPETGLWAIRGCSRVYFGRASDFPVAAPAHWSVPELPVFGVEVMARYLDGDHLDKLVELGAGTTRFGYIHWARVEPVRTDPPSYDWGDYDQIMADYAGRGLRTIVIISDIPAWAGQTRSGPFEPEARDDFARFVGAAVRRYGCPPYNIKHWELFNEPDGTRPDYWAAINTWGYFGKDYALMLAAAYPAIKAADPSARVLIGGLAYDWFVEDGGNFYRPFIDDVLQSGGGDYFDLMNFHYYYFSCERWGNVAGKAAGLREILAGYGLSKPVLCTEVGIWGYEKPYYLALQARYLPKVYARGLSAALGAILWYPLSSRVGDTFEGGLLREEDLSPKPAYYSFLTLTTELEDYRYSATLDTGSDNTEGYVFYSRRNGKTKYLLWAKEGRTGTWSLAVEALRVVSIDGSWTAVTDGGAGDCDGSDNGEIELNLDPSPVYVESW